MHNNEVNCIIANAFNGLGDSTGDDEFGYSVAWISLYDWLEPYGVEGMPTYSDELTAVLAGYVGSPYALACIDSDGIHSVVGYSSKAEVMYAYRGHESTYLAWLEEVEN